MPLAIVLLTSITLILVTVAIHLATLRWLTERLGMIRRHPFLGVAAVIVVALFAHLIEIVTFALGLGFLTRYPGVGRIVGDPLISFRDEFYYSAVTFTSLGYGDLTPTDHLRVFAGIEALTGLVLIAWTASFTFLVMHRLWQRQFDHGDRK